MNRNKEVNASHHPKNSVDQKKATMYYEELLKLTEGVDSDRAELEEAKEFVKTKES